MIIYNVFFTDHDVVYFHIKTNEKYVSLLINTLKAWLQNGGRWNIEVRLNGFFRFVEHIAYAIIHITMTWTSKNSGSLLLLLTIITVNKSSEQYIDCGDTMGVLVWNALKIAEVVTMFHDF